MSRHKPVTIGWAIGCTLIAWLPVLLFELLDPYPAQRVLQSPVLARNFAFASLVCLAIALPIGLLCGLAGAGLARRRGDACGSLGAVAAGLLASALALRSFRTVQDWVLAHGLPIDAGTAAAIVGAAAAAVLAVRVVLLLVPRRWAAAAAAACCAAALGYWLYSVDTRFAVLASTAKLAVALPGAVALALLVVAAALRARLSTRARAALPALVVAAGIAGPIAGVAISMPAAPLPAAAAAAPATDINVVVLMIDTLRADHTSGGGYAFDTTPVMRRLLAERTTEFTNAVAAGASTIPSVKSFFLSLPPSRGDREEENFVPPEREWTIARAFRNSGWATAGFSANELVDGPGFTEGFDEFAAFGGRKYFQNSFFLYDVLSGNHLWRAFRHMDRWRLQKEPAPNVRRLCRRWLDRAPRPFFLYVHFLDPHWPYYDRGFGLVPEALRNLPAPYSHIDLMRLRHGDPANAAYRQRPQMREMIGRYDSEIRFVDQVIGGMLDDLHDLGLDDSTLVIVVADHGEEFFEHNGFGHGHDVYEEQTHVPLLFRWPGRPGFAAMPARVDVPVSLTDVFPTLTDYLDLAPPPRPLFGRSLRPLLEGGETWPAVLSESHVPKLRRKAYREGNLKARFAYSTEGAFDQTEDVAVYDLAEDPHELRPLPADHPRAAAFVRRARDDLRRRFAEIGE